MGFGTQPVFNINYKEHRKADCWICWWAIVLESKRLYKSISHDIGCINMHILLPLDTRTWRQGKKRSLRYHFIYTHTATFVDAMSLWCKFWHLWQLCIPWVMALPFTEVKNSGKNIIQSEVNSRCYGEYWVRVVSFPFEPYLNVPLLILASVWLHAY